MIFAFSSDSGDMTSALASVCEATSSKTSIMSFSSTVVVSFALSEPHLEPLKTVLHCLKESRDIESAISARTRYRLSLLVFFQLCQNQVWEVIDH
jgi:hypothetical protein